MVLSIYAFLYFSFQLTRRRLNQLVQERTKKRRLEQVELLNAFGSPSPSTSNASNEVPIAFGSPSTSNDAFGSPSPSTNNEVPITFGSPSPSTSKSSNEVPIAFANPLLSAINEVPFANPSPSPIDYDLSQSSSSQIDMTINTSNEVPFDSPSAYTSIEVPIDYYDLSLSQIHMNNDSDTDSAFENEDERGGDEAVENGTGHGAEFEDEVQYFEYDETCNYREMVRKLVQENQAAPALGDGMLEIMIKMSEHKTLPKTYKTLMETQTKSSFKVIRPGMYHHIGLKAVCEELGANDEWMKVNGETDRYELTMHIDGLPLSSNSTLQAWTILGSLPQRPDLKPFLLGIYVGYRAPDDFDAYLSDLSNDIVMGQTEGFKLNDSTVVRFDLRYVVADAPARAYISHTKNFSSHKGCPYCTQIGNRVGHHGQQFLNHIQYPLRTDSTYRVREDPDHHHMTHRSVDAPGALEKTGLGMVTQIVPCAQHTWDKGVMKKILSIVFEKSGFFNNEKLKQMNATHKKCQQRFPCEFPKSSNQHLENFSRLQAVELRHILLHSGMIIFRDVFPAKLYSHFLCLSMAARLLADEATLEKERKLAQKLVTEFLNNYTTVYGESLSYVVHTLLHFERYVELYGPMYAFSAYKFENYLPTIRALVHEPTQVLAQIRNGVIKKGNVVIDKKPEQGLTERLTVRNGVSYFATLVHKTATFRADGVNGYAMITSSEPPHEMIIVKIKYFKEYPDQTQTFVYKEIQEIGTFFEMESMNVTSRDFGVFYCSLLDDDKLNEGTFDQIKGKLISIPCQQGRVIQKMINCGDYRDYYQLSDFYKKKTKKK